MKNNFKFLAIAIFLCGFAVSSFAQVTVNSSASATIVATITLTKTYDLDFGNLAVTTTAGDCVLTPMAGTAPTRTPHLGVTLPAFPGTPRAGAFVVTGVSGQFYTITIPETALTITRTTGTETMTVTDFTTDQTVVTPGSWWGTLTGGSSTFYIGGKCNVAANQVPGLYQNLVGGAGGFPVTVNYQ